MQIPVLNGIYTDGDSGFRTSYPRNLVPVPTSTGISQGYLRPADGIVEFGTGPGVDRGGINWRGKCYRVMGEKLVVIREDGKAQELGAIAGEGQCTFDYSLDRLGVCSGGILYYLQDGVLTQVTDGDMGPVLDFVWVDGYFLTTDGTSLIVTELTDPTAVNPLKYGSAEADPDPIVSLVKLRNEVYTCNRYTTEVFQNVGGEFFPFQRIEGAYMMRGAVGTHAVAVFMEQIAFLGGGRNEAPAVWMGSNGVTQKISTREIEQILLRYTEDQLSTVVMEARLTNGHQFLYMHLPDQTWVFDGAGSAAVESPVWFELGSSLHGSGAYRARNFVWCYNKWLCGDPTSSKHGYLTDSVSSHYGKAVGWEFGTMIAYNEGRGAIFHELELACLTGRVDGAEDPTVWTSYTVDGRNWSQERPRSAGKRGETMKRLTWMQQGYMRHWRCQKFRGTSDAHLSIARLEARIEPLNV